MTPEQTRAIADCVTLIRNMRHSQHGDGSIRAGLIAEGWPVAAVNAAFEVLKGESV